MSRALATTDSRKTGEFQILTVFFVAAVDMSKDQIVLSLRGARINIPVSISSLTRPSKPRE